MISQLKVVVEATDKRQVTTLERFIWGLDENDVDDLPTDLRLLDALRTMLTEMGATGFVATETLANALRVRDDWDYMTARSLGCRLKAFGVRSQHSRDKRRRGYKADAILDVAQRYVPRGKTSQTSKTSGRRSRKPRKRKGK